MLMVITFGYGLVCLMHTDGYVLYDWHTVLFPALQCKNDVTFDIHNWVRLKFYTQIYTQLLR